MLGYTVALGLPELRAAIATHYGHTYDLHVDPEEVVVTTGSSGGFLLTRSSPRSTPATGSRWPAPATPATATS